MKVFLALICLLALACAIVFLGADIPAEIDHVGAGLASASAVILDGENFHPPEVVAAVTTQPAGLVNWRETAKQDLVVANLSETRQEKVLRARVDPSIEAAGGPLKLPIAGHDPPNVSDK
ncbi:MAG TPA: hypothetical protein VM492_05165 [Sumerlaeia bacterium]|nr:hypothetical protein [Sumerlaeia bacterium]